jgi:myo-inositol catabolism protein IolS
LKLGFGTWQLGGECVFGGRVTGWGPIDYSEAQKTIERGLENGIRFFDTAPGYGKGKSESFLGEVITGVKDIKICTKFGSLENKHGQAYLDFSKESLLKSLEESLKRLKTDRIDTLLLHGPPDDFDFKNYDIGVFENLKKEGIIKHYGLSVKTHKGAINAINSGFGDSIEAVYNVLERRVETEVFMLNNFKKYQFIARVPLASGYLSSSFFNKNHPEFTETDIRKYLASEDQDWYKTSVASLGFLQKLNGGLSVSSLRFLMGSEHVYYVIPGFKNREQLNEALVATKLGALAESIKKEITSKIPKHNPRWT